MASLIKKKKANTIYYYVVESARVDGKPRIVHQTYLGTAESVARLVQDRSAPVPLSATTVDFGLPGALWLAAENSGVSRTQRRRLAGLGTDVSLDGPEDACPCLLLHARHLAVAMHTPAGGGGMARTLHRRTSGPVAPDPEIHFAIPAPRRQGAKPSRRGAVQAIAYATETGPGTRSRSAR